MPAPLTIEVFFDLVCPWCAIGKRQLEAALADLARERPDVHATLAWHGYPLIPETPAGGVPFAAFYRRRLGSDAAVAARQAQVREAASAVGLKIAFERIATFPSTLAAHRLIERAPSEAASALIDALFERYFVHGENIGDARVLARAAAQCGLDEPALAEAPASDAARLHLREAWHRRGVHGVPHFTFNGIAVSGAQRAGVLLNAMRHAIE